MKQKSLWGCLVSVLAIGFIAPMLLGCNGMTVHDGRMPADLSSQSDQISGLYDGRFAGQSGQMRISMIDDRPVLIWLGENGSDILDQRCSSQVGALREVRWREADGGRKVRALVFGFDPGVCESVQGRSVELTFHAGNRFNMYLLDRRQDEANCVRRLVDGRVAEECRQEPVEHYYSGTFRRRLPR